MFYKGSLGPNSFVLAFDAGHTIENIGDALYDAVTETSGGIPIYGYEKVGKYNTSWISPTPCWYVRSKNLFGEDKLTGFVSRNNLYLDVVFGKDPISTANNRNTPSYIACTDTNNVEKAWMKYDNSQRLYVYVFLSAHWMIVNLIHEKSFYLYDDTDLQGGIGVFDVYGHYGDVQNNDLDSIKTIRSHMAFLSGLGQTYAAVPGTSNATAKRGSFFQGGSLLGASGPLISFDFVQYWGKIDTQYGCPIFPYNTDQWIEYFPSADDVYKAVTLRGKIPQSLGSYYQGFFPYTGEFFISGIKLGVPDNLAFLDKVNLLCDSNYQINTKDGELVPHYVIGGRCGIRGTTTRSPYFRYLIPC